jgi:hypothetical protein
VTFTRYRSDLAFRIHLSSASASASYTTRSRCYSTLSSPSLSSHPLLSEIPSRHTASRSAPPCKPASQIVRPLPTYPFLPTQVLTVPQVFPAQSHAPQTVSSDTAPTQAISAATPKTLRPWRQRAVPTGTTLNRGTIAAATDRPVEMGARVRAARLWAARAASLLCLLLRCRLLLSRRRRVLRRCRAAEWCR